MKEYNIGLDIGTSSVGWAVVEDKTFKLLRKEKKNLWGVRLFEEGKTAKDRRGFRGQRRRYERRKYRIELLRAEFKEEMDRVDPLFFQKLEESKYNKKEDKINYKTKLTNEDMEFLKLYHSYKTIYHLRNELINDTSKKDIRLVYLAIHHLIKYRGNFINENNSVGDSTDNLIAQLQSFFTQLIDNDIDLSDDLLNEINLSELEKTLLNDSNNDIKVKIKELFKTVPNKYFASELGKALTGNKFSINKLFSLDEEPKVEINFKGTDIDDKQSDIEKLLGDKVELITILKNIYDSIYLKKVLKEAKNIPELMVKRYNMHQSDLKLLKSILDYDREIYNKVFRTKKEKCLYDKYISNGMTNEDFIKEVKKYVEKVFDKNEEAKNTYLDKYESSLLRMDNGEFLPRITSTENGKMPYQLNKNELIKIIENQGNYYKFLLNKTSDGEYKLVRILEFKIPYYVGPLAINGKSNFSWLERKVDNVKITPYNFNEIVDKEKTAEAFIKRMISNCTYLLDEPAMPKNSILYSRFKVLNELKQITINFDNSRPKQRLTLNLQKQIITDLFEKTSGSISNDKFLNYLKSLKEFSMADISSIEGYSALNKFANNMQSYVDFFGEDGIFLGTNYQEEDAENIIEWITIFNDKKILEEKVKKNYPELNDKQINKILNKKYNGWGNLSKKLLTTKYYYDKTSNTRKSIIDLMYETKENFMQIINNDEYKFQDMIKEHNIINNPKYITYDVVDDLVTSPANKRAIYQALKVVEELISYIGYEPKNIMIEMTRSEGDKKRTDDRQKKLLKIYENSIDSIENYTKLHKELKNHEKLDDKLYLYFMQEGKCMYSVKPIEIDDLINDFNSEKYEIDHIIPRTLVTDNSWDNRVLVYREYNQNKASSFVVPEAYRRNCMSLWNHLKDIGLISSKKYSRLIRDKYDSKIIEGFINRQIVETSQIVKHVANILNSYYQKTNIVYLKPKLAHDYRMKYKLYKFREINDFHHAHDAYLTAVLGEYQNKYIYKYPNFNALKEVNNKLNTLTDYKNLRYGYIINSLDNDTHDEMNNILLEYNPDLPKLPEFDINKFNNIVQNTLYQNDIFISMKTEIRTGEFFNQTIQKKGSNGFTIKDNMPTKLYGAYTSINPAYAVLLKYNENDKVNQRLVGLPIYLNNANDEKIASYFKNMFNTDSCEIISKPIPFKALINFSYAGIDNQVGYLVGASNKIEVCNAKEFYYDKEFYINHKEMLYKLLVNNKLDINENDYNNGLNEIINYIVNKIDKEYPLFKNLLPTLQNITNIEKLNVYSIEEKENIIKELTKMLNCKSENANLKFLGLSTAFGKKNGKIISNAKIINKSYTGIKVSIYEF